jgi:hypothetical protein
VLKRWNALCGGLFRHIFYACKNASHFSLLGAKKRQLQPESCEKYRLDFLHNIIYRYRQDIKKVIILSMNRNEYIKQLKQLIKKYHPDLCQDEYLEKEYNEITIKLNNKLNQIKNGNNTAKDIVSKNNDKINIFNNKSLINVNNQSYVYYKLGIKYYKNIHPNQFYKRNIDKTYIPKKYEEQLKILNKIFVSFNIAEYYFTKIIMEYPKSEWASDSKDKIKLLKKLYRSYENMDVEKNNQIIDSNKFVNEMGLKIL